MNKYFIKLLMILILTLSFLSLASTKRCYITFSSKGGNGTTVKQECQKGDTIRINPLYAKWSKVGDANDPVIKAQNQDEKIIENSF